MPVKNPRKKIPCKECQFYVEGDEFCHKGKDMDMGEKAHSRCKAWAVKFTEVVEKRG